MSSIFLSIVIPAYNEEERIGESLEQIIAFLGKQSFSHEIIVSDDGSKDGTVRVCREKLSGIEHRICLAKQNSGKGAAVRTGVLAARGEYILFSDADLSTPIEEVERFIGVMKNENYDLVIGSRSLQNSQVEVRQNIIRQSMGKIFNRLARFLSFKNVHDSQCGFKCFKRAVARDLFSRQKLDDFSFDAEIIYLAQMLGYRLAEEPVRWRNSPNSRVNIIKDSFLMLIHLVQIKSLHRQEPPRGHFQ